MDKKEKDYLLRSIDAYLGLAKEKMESLLKMVNLSNKDIARDYVDLAVFCLRRARFRSVQLALYEHLDEDLEEEDG